ncbi:MULTISPECIES: hypothetical protein [unclassified Bradyrhizobium]|uniref:hypothetical protein n=1 Tax=unclassified Bradyrhizobium TaxID=2631580 RepID=UPI001BA4DBCE|nr:MULTISPECIES: hypothetical protein [unclassified Bradyrhizobium]MBR1204515.1 hypothetical protein [Bradyrhizobium sp. AUGA SZCCT0124]MBR1309599.1 hypothetical protein [Bradyrhizobium sp. AUGA SZCCT0051]MBR1339740.1 hypothetical protein [Bradyrhizobium sp. AUGA SZCCT0105]MBR1354347.1 hypothetical protein [Bradyrhizobium sp. AUGA SZCCT0045]
MSLALVAFAALSATAQTASGGDKQEQTIYQSICGDTHSHDVADLCEQKRMSSAAERAADYAYWQLYISAVGLAAVVVSLAFAGMGAFAARDAAKIGTRATLIARNAERPYVVSINPMILETRRNVGKDYDPVLVRDFPTVLDIHFDLSNVGRGGAVILGYGINHEVCAASSHGSKDLITRDGFGGFVLSPGSVLKVGG